MLGMRHIIGSTGGGVSTLSGSSTGADATADVKDMAAVLGRGVDAHQ